MQKKIHKLKGIKLKSNSKNCEIQMEVDFGRVEQNLNRAQYLLDSAVMNSMVRFMPQSGTGNFISRTQAMSQAVAGSGIVVAAAPPFGRFLYEGKKMVDSVTGKGPRPIEISPGEVIYRHRKGAELVPTTEKLNLYKGEHPDATDHWFDAAKAADGDDWVEMVKSVAGGGKKGSIMD